MTVEAQWVTVVAQRATVVAQRVKAPGLHGYVAGSIPAVTPRYCTIKTIKCSSEHKKSFPFVCSAQGYCIVFFLSVCQCRYRWRVAYH
jgi:hypothetical protein